MATCHPDRPHQSLGLCNRCYQKEYRKRKGDELNAKRRQDPDGGYSPNYRKPPHLPQRNADCHPDRPHKARGLCESCYSIQRTNQVMATCHPDRPHLANGLCTVCVSKRRYEMDPEAARRLSRESQARTRKRNRDQLIEAYGGKCACPKCPETNTAFLTLEHVNGDGRKHRAERGSHTYADLRRRGYPKDGYTLLCWNCNAMTRYGRTCPHEED